MYRSSGTATAWWAKAGSVTGASGGGQGVGDGAEPRPAGRASRPVWLALAVLLLTGACGGGPYGDPVRFTVARGSGVSAVADTLAAREIIDWPEIFRLYSRTQGASRSIKPGVYEVRRGTAWGEILRKLVLGDVVTMTVVVPEGWTAAQIGARIAAATGSPPDSVMSYLLSDSVAAALGVPGPTLEGYLYPATYQFPLGTPYEAVARALVNRYLRVWTPEMRARADSLEMSKREVMTLASIVEKEAKRWEERDTIAAVYHNRLRIGMPLQADPTVQYALGEHQTRLLYSHIDDVAENPYNTYTHRGLPPGPIASASEGAIRATLHPADVDFLYFVARRDGSHVFTRSLAEHNAAKARIRREANAAAAEGGA
jgi:UPF0755 protein